MLRRFVSAPVLGGLYLAALALLLIGLITGAWVGPGAAGPASPSWLPSPVAGVDPLYWHIAAGVLAAGGGGACWVGLRTTRAAEGSSLLRAAALSVRSPRPVSFGKQTLGLLWPILMLLGVTGVLVVAEVDLGRPLVGSWLIELHRVAAWALAGVITFHVVRAFRAGVAAPAAARRCGAEAPTGAAGPPSRRLHADIPASPRELRAIAERASTIPQQLRMYLAGCACFAFGTKCFIDADLGVDPLHAMTLGLVAWLDLPFFGVGLADSLVTVLLLAVWTACNRRLPPLAIFVTMALVGYMIDLCNALDLHLWTQAGLPATPLMILGLVLDAYGSALIIMSGIGIRVVDLVAITLMERLRCRFYVAKLALEASFFFCAWLLGGALGLATVGFLIVVGPFMEPMMRANHRLLGLPNYGLPREPIA